VFERFIARQVILKDNLILLGYELRFRADDSRADASNGSSAARLIDASTMVFHWESLTANALAFVSLGEPELLSGVALVLPRSKAVIEIADSVPCTAEVIPACQSLKTAGYRIALAGPTGNTEQHPLAALADFLLVDVGKLPVAEQRVTVSGHLDGKAAPVARGVDSWEEHKRARCLGFRFFQGDFFLTPQLFWRRESLARGETPCASCRQSLRIRWTCRRLKRWCATSRR